VDRGASYIHGCNREDNYVFNLAKEVRNEQTFLVLFACTLTVAISPHFVDLSSLFIFISSVLFVR
jgi:hypothetical protein